MTLRFLYFRTPKDMHLAAARALDEGLEVYSSHGSKLEIAFPDANKLKEFSEACGDVLEDVKGG